MGANLIAVAPRYPNSLLP